MIAGAWDRVVSTVVVSGYLTTGTNVRVGRQLGMHKHQELFMGLGYIVLPNRWKTCCAGQAVGKCNVDRGFLFH